MARQKQAAKSAEAMSETGETEKEAKAVPEQASATQPEAVIATASNSDEGKAQPDAAEVPSTLHQSVNPNLRRFVVLKPVRFEGKRIPRASRVTITRAGHGELASLGAVSPVWDHGVPVKAAQA